MAKSLSPKIAKPSTTGKAAKRTIADGHGSKQEAAGANATTTPPNRSNRTKTRAELMRTKDNRMSVPEDLVRQRAHEIFLARNGGPGDSVSDWLQAEQELRGKA